MARCGEWDIKSEQELNLHQDRRIANITMHPIFVGGNRQFNNVALLHTKREFKLTENVNTICLPKFGTGLYIITLTILDCCRNYLLCTK